MRQYLDIFGSKVGVFPLCVGIGLFLYVMLILRTSQQMGADEQKENSILCPLPFALISGVVVAYFSDVVNHWSLKLFLKNPLGFGITYYGFLLGMIVFVIFYTCIRKLNTFFYLNMWIPPLSLAQACGRIGCFCAGCCYGIPCNSSYLSVIYPENSLPFQKFGTIPLLPIQLIEAFYLFGLSVLLYKIKFHKRFVWYLIWVGLGRFLTEFGRGDNRGQIVSCTILSPAQIISIILLITGIILFFTKMEKLKNGKLEN